MQHQPTAERMHPYVRPGAPPGHDCAHGLGLVDKYCLPWFFFEGNAYEIKFFGVFAFQGPRYEAAPFLIYRNKINLTIPTIRSYCTHSKR